MKARPAEMNSSAPKQKSVMMGMPIRVVLVERIARYWEVGLSVVMGNSARNSKLAMTGTTMDAVTAT